LQPGPDITQLSGLLNNIDTEPSVCKAKSRCQTGNSGTDDCDGPIRHGIPPLRLSEGQAAFTS
jgi:hypothetical protein